MTGGGAGYFRNNPTSMIINNTNDPMATYAIAFPATRIFVALGRVIAVPTNDNSKKKYQGF